MIGSLLNHYKISVEQAIKDNMDSFGSPSVLRDAIEYALKNGKRFRAAIVYLVATALGHKKDMTEAALAIEYFHTASLIADDLPCMDDDDERRDLPALHKAFNEATAVLTTYALIAAGYDKIRQGAAKMGRPDIGMLAIENASFNTGILGAAGGQYHDLYPPKLTDRAVLDVIDKKTGTLFEISFVFGWLFGGGNLHSLEVVKQMARSFGRAFQISDDCLDHVQDAAGMNYVTVAGKDKALSLLHQELNQYYTALKTLQLATPELMALGELIEARI
jgi:geranylgeranyl diphosphate synthase, type II